MSEVMKQRFASFAEAHEGKGILELGARFVSLAAELEEISTAKALLESEKEYLRCRLAEKMGEENVPRFSVGDKRINVREELFVSAPGEIAVRVLDVLKDTGNGSLVKETVAPATLKKFIENLRDKSKDGMPDPVLSQLLGVGVTLRVVDMARFY